MYIIVYFETEIMIRKLITQKINFSYFKYLVLGDLQNMCINVLLQRVLIGTCTYVHIAHTHTHAHTPAQSVLYLNISHTTYYLKVSL